MNIRHYNIEIKGDFFYIKSTTGKVEYRVLHHFVFIKNCGLTTPNMNASINKPWTSWDNNVPVSVPL